VLTLNVGSSSIKVAVYDGDVLQINGSLARTDDRRWALTWNGATSQVTLADDNAAVDWLVELLASRGLLASSDAVGHRVVHGGRMFTAPVWITPPVLETLASLIPLAPDHLPRALRAIRTVTHHAPALPQAACFDTAFHHGLPDVARLFGISHSLADAGVVRYGFHGLSCEFVVAELTRLGALGSRTLIAHLGNGASVTAVRDGRSVDTTMGLTPAGGVVMGTRSGDLDPGVMLYLLREQHLTPDAVNGVVNDTGGLLGVSGTTGDVRTLLGRRDTDPRAALAIGIFCYHIRKAIGAMTAALGGLDTLVFTAGIGEHSAEVRSEICRGLDCPGIRLDPSRNANHAQLISPEDAPVAVRVVGTNEELMIARHVGALMRASSGKA
jgi:acetate kinase